MAQEQVAQQGGGAPPRVLVEQVDGVTVARFPRKHVDGLAVRELYEAAAALSNDRDGRLLVDLTGVPTASSGLLGILAAIQKVLRHAGGRVHIAVPDQNVRRQFAIMRLDVMLKLFDDAESAKQAF